MREGALESTFPNSYTVYPHLFLKDPIKAIMNVAIHRDTRVIIKRKCVPY